MMYKKHTKFVIHHSEILVTTCPVSQKFTSEQQFTQGTKMVVDSQGCEAEAGGKQIQGHPGLQEEILSGVVEVIIIIIINIKTTH